MQPKSALAVFMLLVASSIIAGVDSMLNTGRLAQADVDRALELALTNCDADRIDADTVRVYRENITDPLLRDTAYIAMAAADDEYRLRPSLSAHTGLSVLQLWQLSDQRASGVLAALAALWLACCMGLVRQVPKAEPLAETCTCQADIEQVGGSDATASGAADENAGDVASRLMGLRLTPMQRELVEMFLSVPGGRLLQQDICNRLWPKKPDASATLYTLIRRIKAPLAEAKMTIECERGEAYRLVEMLPDAAG